MSTVRAVVVDLLGEGLYCRGRGREIMGCWLEGEREEGNESWWLTGSLGEQTRLRGEETMGQATATIMACQREKKKKTNKS